ncbi:unnamed protein product, partial [Vitis vinifera]
MQPGLGLVYTFLPPKLVIVLSISRFLFIYYYVYLHLCSLRRSLQEISKSTVSLEQLNPIYLNNP